MGNLPPFTPLPLMSSPSKTSPVKTTRTIAKPKAPAKPSVSTIETILGKSPLPLMQPPAKPKTVTRTNVVSVAGPGGDSGYTNTPQQQQQPKSSPGSRVINLQKSLVAKGYQLSVDGIQGPLTTAAAADARHGGNAAAWNAAHSGHGVAAAAETAANTPPPVPSETTKTAPVKPRVPAASSVTSAVAQPSVEEQAKAIVDSILNPLIDNVRSTENARAEAGQKMIGGYTSNAIDQLKGIDMQAPYTAAAGGANAVNDATLALLQGKGSDLAAGVGAKLAAAGQNPSGVVSGINADTAGAAGAGYAKGGATVESLLGEGASAGGYGKKLPGIEALAGQQNSSLLQGQVNTDTAKELSAITSQAPQLIQSTLANLHTQDSQDKALKINAILASGYDPATGSLTPAAQKALAAITGTDPGALAGAPKGTKVAAPTVTKVNPGVSKLLGYVSDASGNPIVSRDGKIVPVDASGAKGQPKTPTANELNKFVDAWHDGKATTQHTPVLNPDGSPVTDANGAPVYRTTDGPKTGNLGYGQAYKRLLLMNAFGGDEAKVRALLDTKYMRGDEGRAWLTNEEQSALKNAGLAPKATRYKSVAYLTKDQVTALQQAHKLPSGQWAGNHYVIDQGF